MVHRSLLPYTRTLGRQRKCRPLIDSTRCSTRRPWSCPREPVPRVAARTPLYERRNHLTSGYFDLLLARCAESAISRGARAVPAQRTPQAWWHTRSASLQTARRRFTMGRCCTGSAVFADPLPPPDRPVQATWPGRTTGRCPRPSGSFLGPAVSEMTCSRTERACLGHASNCSAIAWIVERTVPWLPNNRWAGTAGTRQDTATLSVHSHRL
jgi:hypothetical protein